MKPEIKSAWSSSTYKKKERIAARASSPVDWTRMRVYDIFCGVCIRADYSNGFQCILFVVLVG